MLLHPPRPAAAAEARGAAAAALLLLLLRARRAVATSCMHWLALNGPNTGYTQDIKHELSK